MEISQDPVIGTNQSLDRFWSRVEVAYNSSINDEWEKRNNRSLQSRMQAIEKAVKKLKGCVRQVENYNPSGASNKDILNRAKRMLMDDPNFKKGFKFDHVWEIMKDFEKFKDNTVTQRKIAQKHSSTYLSSESNNPTLECQGQASPGLSQFSLNLDDFTGGSSSDRPCETKKAKLKKKLDEQLASAVNRIEEGNRKIMERLEKSDAERQRQINDFLEIQRQKREDKILLRDLNVIIDPDVRAYMQAQKAQILRSRGQSQQPPSPAPNMFSEFFNNIGEEGADIPPY